MKCQELEAILTEDLTQALRADIRQHLRDCVNCERLFHELEAIEDLNFSLARMTEAPVDFSLRVTRRLQRRRWRQTGFAVAGTLALLVLGFAGILNLQSAMDSQPVAATAGSEFVLPGVPTGIILADPATSSDREEEYLEYILGEPLTGVGSTRGVPSEIKVHRTDMGKVNLTHVSH